MYQWGEKSVVRVGTLICCHGACLFWLQTSVVCGRGDGMWLDSGLSCNQRYLFCGQEMYVYPVVTLAHCINSFGHKCVINWSNICSFTWCACCLHIGQSSKLWIQTRAGMYSRPLKANKHWHTQSDRRENDRGLPFFTTLVQLPSITHRPTEKTQCRIKSTSSCPC